MAQQWCDLLFAHWPVPVETMRALVPTSLRLDLHDGKAWVGVVPFRMQGVRPRWTPSVPWLSSFCELNVRTYVTSEDRGRTKPGVYFFSLEAANPVAVRIARGLFKLPYFHAKMLLQREGGAIRYESERTHRGAAPAVYGGTYEPTSAVFESEPESFDAWLTERYALYTTDRTERPFIGEIHHAKWPLQRARATFERNTMAEASGIELPEQEPVLHFAEHLDVVVWPLRRAEP